MASNDFRTLPILPLPQGAVLLPGAALRVPVSGRSDVPSLLSAIYTNGRSSKTDRKPIKIGCVPINSPALRSDGQPLPEHEQRHNVADIDAVEVGRIDHRRLFMFGTLAKISGVQGHRAGNLSLIVEGLERFRIDRFVQMRPHFEAEVAFLERQPLVKLRKSEDIQDGISTESFEKLKSVSLELLELLRIATFVPRSSLTLSPLLARRLEVFVGKKEIDEASSLTDFMANLVATSVEDRLRVLASGNVTQRSDIMVDVLMRQIKTLRGSDQIVITTDRPITKTPNSSRENGEAILRRALGDLSGFNPTNFGGPGRNDGEAEDEPNEIEELKRKLDEANMTPDALKVAEKELRRLKKMNPAQAEFGVCRTYIETLTEIPWSKSTEDKLDTSTLRRARKQLDDDHYGLDKIKKRLLEYLAVLRLKQAVNEGFNTTLTGAGRKAADSEALEIADGDSDSPSDGSSGRIQVMQARRRVDNSPILLLVGPPGTGKTSLARSIATALGRKFHRISLGGVRDEAEIRGHRRTYVAAMPGLIVNGLRKVQVNNPVFLLDEIDKVGGNSFHGDPSAAMLEVLDPEQNYTFTDHYVNVPMDLSKVLFIATANTLDTIPAPLLDRMETIALSGYTTVEKRHIANQHLVPKQISSNGLDLGQVILPDEVLDTIITSYTRESGVRNLEREIGSVCRCKAVQYAEARDDSDLERYRAVVSEDDLEEMLGTKPFEDELAEKKSVPGIVTGLVAYSTGGQGSILFIEIADMPGTGRVQLTGKLGDVLKESVEVALSWVKAHAYDLGLSGDRNEDIMKHRSIHVHCPSGAIPKDGPSAGLAHTIAMISLFSGRAVPPEIAMTGEVSLRGRVMPVGGIKEKLIGAHRAGVKVVLLPKSNRKDTKDVPQEVLDGLDIVHVGHIWEAMRHIWPNVHWPGEEAFASVESRL